MILYISAFAFSFLSQFSKQLRENKQWKYLFLFLLGIFLCSGYMTGSDWRSYEPMYEKIDFSNLFFDYYAEPGYYIYMLLFKMFSIEFWSFFIFTKIVCYIIFINRLIHYSGKYFYLSLTFFIPWFGIYLFIDNPMRNLLAITIFLCSIKYIIERKKSKYMLMILLAASFHISSLMFLLFYFFANRNVRTNVYILYFLLFNLVFANRELLIRVVDLLFGNIPYVAYKINAYVIEHNEAAGGRLFSLGMLFHILFFVLLLWKRKLIESMPFGEFIFNCAVCYLILYRLSTTVEIFSRFQLFLSLFYCISISFLINAFSKKSRIIYAFYLLLLAFIANTKIFADERYIPYTNYFSYFIKGDLPSYKERAAFNYRHSPYVKE